MFPDRFRCRLRVSAPRPRLSSDPEEKKAEHNRTAAKKPCTKEHGHPPHRAKAHQGKCKAQKNQSLCRTPKGAGGTKRGKKTGTGKKSPPTHKLSTQSQEQSQPKQHLGPAPKAWWGIAQKALKDLVLRRRRQTRGQNKSPNKTPKKKRRKKGAKTDQPHMVEEARRPSSQPRH